MQPAHTRCVDSVGVSRCGQSGVWHAGTGHVPVQPRFPGRAGAPPSHPHGFFQLPHHRVRGRAPPPEPPCRPRPRRGGARGARRWNKTPAPGSPAAAATVRGAPGRHRAGVGTAGPQGGGCAMGERAGGAAPLPRRPRPAPPAPPRLYLRRAPAPARPAGPAPPAAGTRSPGCGPPCSCGGDGLSPPLAARSPPLSAAGGAREGGGAAAGG